jgi:hypothetical protein
MLNQYPPYSNYGPDGQSVPQVARVSDVAEASQSAILVGPSFDQDFARKWMKAPVLNNVPVEVLGVAEPDASILKAFVPGAGRSSGTANLFCGGIRRRSLYDVP